MHFRLLFLIVMAASLAAGRAHAIPASKPSDICPDGSDPCTVRSGFVYQVSGLITTLDFGARAVIFEQGARIEVTTGPAATLELRAGSVRLEPNAAIINRAGTIEIETTGDVLVRRDTTRRFARLEVDDSLSPGVITIAALGDVGIEGLLQARGTGNEGGLGEVAITGRSVDISGEILAMGNKLGDGGTVTVASLAGPILISGGIDASGGLQAGFIGIDATGGSIITSRGLMADNSKLDIRSIGSGGYGGEVELTATGDIQIGSPIRGSGSAAGSDDFGGDGGDVTIFSDRSFSLENGAVIELHGAVPEGGGGGLQIEALDVSTVNGTIGAVGQSLGFGGLFEAGATRSMVLGNVDLHCTDCTSGELIASAWCDLTVPSTKVLDVRGSDGTIDLVSGGNLVIAGRLRSTRNALFHRSEAPPQLAGALIEPAAVVTPDDALTPCGGFPSENCGNGIDGETGEECDDGNNESCDGCSSTCRDEACGNGRIDCGEVCDDGAAVDECAGDCAADCMSLFPVCGNDVTECDEDDDDGNQIDCDGVSSSCRIEECGNGVRECGEECDDAADPDCNVAACRLAPVDCGNDILDQGELCDDGNTDDCDGCSHVCTPEGCGNNIPETCPVGSPVPSEECDDGNDDCLDGCSPTCRVEVCGNGIRDCGEPCDEGSQNGQPGSSCLAVDDGEGNFTCQEGELCTPESEGPCIPCGTTLECDPLNRCGLAACQDGVCVPVNPPDCDDDDACTADSCNPASGCAHRDTCNDADACTDDFCDSATGCSHTTVQCDDGDLCTDDSCDAIAGCQLVERTSFAAVACRTDTLDALLAAATDAELHPKARKKILALLRKLRGKLSTAESNLGAGRTRKVTKAMKAADKAVAKLGAFVGKQRGKRVGTPLAEAMLEAINDLDVRVRTLESTLEI